MGNDGRSGTVMRTEWGSSGECFGTMNMTYKAIRACVRDGADLDKSAGDRRRGERG